jgi:prevent-host-death family protein
MKEVKIAALKSRLSHHLRQVRAGEALMVLDRSTPIARIVPIDAGDDIVITKPAPNAPSLGTIRLPPPTKLPFDVLTLLLEDRNKRG